MVTVVPTFPVSGENEVIVGAVLGAGISVGVAPVASIVFL